MLFKEKLKKQYSNIELKVGIFGGTYLDGTPVPLVATAQEYGTTRMPSRPFMRNSINNKKRWVALVQSSLNSGKEVSTAFSLLGALVVSDIKQSIVKGSYIPLKDSTIAKKGFTKPLIDTGLMQNSVDWKIV